MYTPAKRIPVLKLNKRSARNAKPVLCVIHRENLQPTIFKFRHFTFV
jgi:hypothetical protein